MAVMSTEYEDGDYIRINVVSIGIHWYADEIFVVPFALDQAHEEYPDKFLLYTEACTGDRPWDIGKVIF